MTEQIEKPISGRPVPELAEGLTVERNASGSQVYGERQARGYEDDPEYTLFPQERQVWLAAVDALGLSADARVLDLGAGTGALLAALTAHGLDAVGLEPSAVMIQQGLVLHPELKAIDFKHGDAGAMTSEDGKFDLIVSRQVICHFDQPDRDFRRMRGLLKPGGMLLLVDGFWPATSWSPDQLANLPLAALTTADPVAELLRNVGFAIERAEPFLALNDARRAAFPASKDRYIVIARRN